MKAALLAASVLAVTALCGGDKLRITDATNGEGGSTVGRFALAWAQRKDLELSVRKLDAEAALERLGSGDTDMVLLKDGALPSAFAGKHRVYACRALVAAVNAKNPVRSMTRAQLKKILTAPRPTWAEAGGNGTDIHRYCVKRGDGDGIVGERELNLFSAADEILKLGGFDEALLLTEADPAALTLGPYQPFLPEETAVLGIDGVLPTPGNIRSGAYKLREAYVVAVGEKPNATVDELFELLKTKEFYEMLEADGFVTPAPSGKR